MRELTVERRSRWLGRRRRTRIDLPESYGELSGSQFEAVVAYSKGWLTADALFCRFFGLTADELATLDPFEIHVLSATLDFLNTLPPVSRFLIPTIPCTMGGRVVETEPPGEKLSGMTFQQFMSVDTFHAWYIYSGKEHYLYNFIVSLYTDPTIPFADMRPAESVEGMLAHECNTRERMEAVVVNWMLVKQWLSDAYPRLFPKNAPEATEQHSKGKKARPASWLPIFDALVDEDLTRVESYQTLPAIDVIRIINRKLDTKKKR